MAFHFSQEITEITNPRMFICLCGKSGNWLLHFVGITSRKILFCTTRSQIVYIQSYCHILFHMISHKPKLQSSLCKTIVPFTSCMINCMDIAKISIEHGNFPWDDQCLIYFSVSMDLKSVVHLSLFQTKILPICKFLVSQLCLWCLLIAVISDLHLLRKIWWELSL